MRGSATAHVIGHKPDAVEFESHYFVWNNTQWWTVDN